MVIRPFAESVNITRVWQWWSHSSLSVHQLCMEQSANTKLPQNRQETQMRQCLFCCLKKGTTHLSYDWYLATICFKGLSKCSQAVLGETSSGNWQSSTPPLHPLWWRHGTQPSPDLSAFKFTYSHKWSKMSFAQRKGGGEHTYPCVNKKPTLSINWKEITAISYNIYKNILCKHVDCTASLHPLIFWSVTPQSSIPQAHCLYSGK